MYVFVSGEIIDSVGFLIVLEKNSKGVKRENSGFEYFSGTGARCLCHAGHQVGMRSCRATKTHAGQQPIFDTFCHFEMVKEFADAYAMPGIR